MNQRELFLRHVAQTSESPMMGLDIDIVSASGVTLVTRDGKKYTDLISGISVSSVGHCHPEVVAAVAAQAAKFMHLMVYGEFNQSPQVAYATYLTSFLPTHLSSVFFTTSGSEAVEGALKLAKRYTGRTGLVSFRGAYHGSTHGALSVMGDEFFRNSYRPLLPGVKQLEYNNEEQLDEITSDTAAVIIEPVQGEAGVRMASSSFLQALRKKCTECGALLIFDEIQTGFGRTGTLFAFEQSGVVPDILLMAKAMGGGLPIGAFVSSPAIMQTLTHNPPLGHINTFGGNAVCVAAAHAALNVIVTGNLHERSSKIGRMVTGALKHPLIKEVRVIGALGAVEFYKEEVCMKVIRRCIEKGVITDWFLFCTTAMRIAPPLTITDDELSAAIDIIKSVLDKSL
jgi:acetylornithine/N-succinyldiaminopimelate aminotransferase